MHKWRTQCILPYLYLGWQDGKLNCVLFSFHSLFSLYFHKFYLCLVDYNVVLVSRVQRSDSVMCVHICILFSCSVPIQVIKEYWVDFPGGSDGKESAYNVGDPGSIPGGEDPLEKEMATHSSILAWRIPWREEPHRLQSMGSQRVRHNLATSLSLSGYLSGGVIQAVGYQRWVQRAVPGDRSWHVSSVNIIWNH